MYLRIIGDGFTGNVFREIEAITNRALLEFDKVRYDQARGVLSALIERFRTKKGTKFFRSLTSYSQVMSEKIQSLVTVRNVINCRIEKNTDDPTLQKITVIFGVMVKGNEIYLCSAEEERGKVCYSLELGVSRIDVEICDAGEEVRSS